MKTIATKGGIHNVYLTPDAKYIVAGSIAGKHLEVIDAATSEQFLQKAPQWMINSFNLVVPQFDLFNFAGFLVCQFLAKRQ